MTPLRTKSSGVRIVPFAGAGPDEPAVARHAAVYRARGDAGALLTARLPWAWLVWHIEWKPGIWHALATTTKGLEKIKAQAQADAVINTNKQALDDVIGQTQPFHQCLSGSEQFLLLEKLSPSAGSSMQRSHQMNFRRG